MHPLTEFFAFAGIGALAQLVDGALGVAYGVVSSALLLGIGMPPVLASASVHYAETFTCAASGLSHLVAGNVRRQLCLHLALPGVGGALLGVYVALRIPASWMRAALAPYLLAVGAFLILRGLSTAGLRTDVPRGTAPLGFVAGFLDAVAGGGWSAISVSALLARGVVPRLAIGSAHLAKCAVSAAASIAFLAGLGSGHASAVLGLIGGGLVAAPVGAQLLKRLPARAATLLAGAAVLALGINNLVRALR